MRQIVEAGQSADDFIVKEYKFDSVQAFYKELSTAKREKLDYEATCADFEKICGNKVTESVNVRDRRRQKEQVVKEREASRVHRARRKDKGAR